MSSSAAKSLTAYIDTTELFQRYLMHTKEWAELLERAQRGQVKLVFPEVVLQEAERQYIESLDKTVAADMKHRRTLTVQGFESVEQYLAPQRETLASNYRATVERKIEDVAGEILPLPKASHQDMLNRAKFRRKPFNASGKGYQDALVWHSILEHLTAHVKEFLDNPPALVTDNHSDYCETPGRLAQELQAEVAEIAEGLALEHSASIRDLIEQLRQRYEAEDLARRQRVLLQTVIVADDQDFDDSAVELDTRITQAVEGAASELLGQPVKNWDDEQDRESALVINYALPDELSDASIEEVEIVPNSLDYQAHEHYEGDTLALTATVEATVKLDGFITKADYYMMEDDSIEVYDDDWNDHSMWVGLERTMQLTFNLITIGEVVESVQFEGAEIV